MQTYKHQISTSFNVDHQVLASEIQIIAICTHAILFNTKSTTFHETMIAAKQIQIRKTFSKLNSCPMQDA